MMAAWGGGGAIGTAAGAACSATGGAGEAGGELSFEITCPDSHFFSLPL